MFRSTLSESGSRCATAATTNCIPSSGVTTSTNGMKPLSSPLPYISTAPSPGTSGHGHGHHHLVFTRLHRLATLQNVLKCVVLVGVLYQLGWLSRSGYGVSSVPDSPSSLGPGRVVTLQPPLTLSSSSSSSSSSSGETSDGNGKKRVLPSVLIIGARKCGTRALIDMLNLHPQVEKAQMEVHFFDRDENYEKGLEWYETQMPEVSENQITIEKSPSYFVTPEVPERVYGMNSTIKLLLIVREPVTRVISDYTQIYYYSNSSGSSSSSSSSSSGSSSGSNGGQQAQASSSKLGGGAQPQPNNHQPVPGFAAAPPPPPQPQPPPPPPLSSLILHPDGSINTNYKAVRISIYSRYLQRWLDIFPTSQIHVIDGDALIRDPFTQLQEVEKFLNLEAKLKREDFYFNSTKGFYCWKKHEGGGGNETAATTHNTVHCLNNSKGRKHPNVDRRIVRKLREFYHVFNQRFYSMVGRDFGWPEN